MALGEISREEVMEQWDSLFAYFVFYIFLALEDSVQFLGQIRLIELNSASVKKGDFEIQTGLYVLAAKYNMNFHSYPHFYLWEKN